MHKWFELVAAELRVSGIDMRKALAKDIEIPATPELVKECIWRVTQNAMFSKESTTELTTKQVIEVYEVLNKHLGETLHIHVPFPSLDELMLHDLSNN